MISTLAWDSTFFGRKIGELKISRDPFFSIETALNKAEAEGFQYILCRTRLQNAHLIRFLESAGFHLSDIGITWSVRTAKFTLTGSAGSEGIRKPVAVAAARDIPMLKKITPSLFLESRFYHDPFFSKKEADSLYLTWVENAVKGKAADIVFCVPGEGYITCKKRNRSGEIVLLGVRKESRGKGTGTALVKKAMGWFTAQGLHSVSVRTQLRNLDAMNFYGKLGFTIKSHDMIFGKILQKPRHTARRAGRLEAQPRTMKAL